MNHDNMAKGRIQCELCEVHKATVVRPGRGRIMSLCAACAEKERQPRYRYDGGDWRTENARLDAEIQRQRAYLR